MFLPHVQDFLVMGFCLTPMSESIKPLNELFCSSIICCCLFCNRCFNIFVPIFPLLIAQIQLSFLLHISGSCTFLIIIYAIFKLLPPILTTINQEIKFVKGMCLFFLFPIKIQTFELVILHLLNCKTYKTNNN